MNNSTGTLNFAALVGVFYALLEGMARLILIPVDHLVRHVPAIQRKASKIARDEGALSHLEQESLFLAHDSSIKMPTWRRHLLKGERRQAAEQLAPPTQGVQMPPSTCDSTRSAGQGWSAPGSMAWRPQTLRFNAAGSIR